ncbi:hypothetical protein C8F04DRAFT_1322698 [Mycena alexandri]|uniref:Uncharacterized protein n=1 Tax=Mycena alexandri TaxID=1745969 RepID=A0AAD6TH41_9AGAR|nr:hypothetical protein C8F04DRAFT_1322698 [Mycena alexandri]
MIMTEEAMASAGSYDVTSSLWIPATFERSHLRTARGSRDRSRTRLGCSYSVYVNAKIREWNGTMSMNAVLLKSTAGSRFSRPSANPGSNINDGILRSRTRTVVLEEVDGVLNPIEINGGCAFEYHRWMSLGGLPVEAYGSTLSFADTIDERLERVQSRDPRRVHAADATVVSTLDGAREGCPEGPVISGERDPEAIGPREPSGLKVGLAGWRVPRFQHAGVKRRDGSKGREKKIAGWCRQLGWWFAERSDRRIGSQSRHHFSVMAAYGRLHK